MNPYLFDPLQLHRLSPSLHGVSTAPDAPGRDPHAAVAAPSSVPGLRPRPALLARKSGPTRSLTRVAASVWGRIAVAGPSADAQLPRGARAPCDA